MHNFSVTIARCFEDMCQHFIYFCTARPQNSLPIECFPLAYDRNVFKPKINSHPLSSGSS